MRNLIFLLFIPPMLLGLLGFSFTWGKLNAMRQIRGWKPGATVISRILTDKAVSPPSTCYVTWNGGNIQTPGNHRLNVPKNLWESYSIGDPIEIVYLANDPRPYHRDGIYASDGNFIFDYVVLAVEIAMFLIPLLGMLGTAVYFRRSPRQRPSNLSFRVEAS